MTTDPTAPSSRTIGDVADELRAILTSSVVSTDHDIGALTTYRVGGRARLFVEVLSSEDLAAVVSVTRNRRLPVVVVGRGSNMLVADAGFPGLALQLGEAFARIELRDDAIVRIGGAASLPAAARRITAAGLTGFEWAVGVPGSLGGAIRMNAGGHGSDMAANVVSARVLDLTTGSVDDLDLDDLAFGYRTSAIRHEHLVVWADLALEPAEPATGEAIVRDIVRWRREHQPGGQNAGSVFTNPPGDSAGRLIDEAGLKGFRIGTAEVSTKHANFIQADPGGRAADVAAVMVAVIDAVRERTGVTLHAETRLVGFPPATEDAVYRGRQAP